MLNPRGPGGPATPQLNQPMPYPNPRAAASPQVGHPMPTQHPQFRVGNALAELDLERLPEHQKKVESDWFAIFNPEVPRVLDVDLLHTLQHESVVCCVRFSHDGKYVATGCNRSAQIFDIVTGQKICILQDESVDSVGDLYIRSVCFSPDGRYLATGAEDKLIRVWDIASRTIRNTFAGHEQDIYSLDFARDGRTIASGSGDRTVRLWDIEAGQNILTLSIEDGVTTVAISPDTKLVAAGSLDKSVRVWDAVSGYLVERLEGPDGHKDSVYSVAFAPNGKDLVSGSLDKTIKMWELVAPRGGHPNNAPKGGRCIRTFEGHKVCLYFSLRMLLISKRTLFSLLLSHQMETGFFPAPRTVEFNSGIQELVILNLCCKATRIVSFLSHLVQLVDLSRQEVEICALESGHTSHTKARECKMNRLEIRLYARRVGVIWQAYFGGIMGCDDLGIFMYFSYFFVLGFWVQLGNKVVKTRKVETRNIKVKQIIYEWKRIVRSYLYRRLTSMRAAV